MATLKSFKPHKNTFRYYLYRHIRLDTNEVFYIGVGTKRNRSYFYTLENEFERSYSNNKRNSFWHNIVNKTDYEVEIMLESDDYDYILEKEIYFINLYGRRDQSEGSLTNLCDGGKRGLNQFVSKDDREKRSISLSGKNHPFYGTKRSKKTRKRISEAKRGVKFSNEHKKALSEAKKGPRPHLRGKNSPVATSVLKLDINTGRILKEYNTIKEAGSGINDYAGSNIVQCCKGKLKSAYGFDWRYKE